MQQETALSLGIHKQLSGGNEIYGGQREKTAVGFQVQRPRGEKAEPVRGAPGWVVGAAG